MGFDGEEWAGLGAASTLAKGSFDPLPHNGTRLNLPQLGLEGNMSGDKHESDVVTSLLCCLWRALVRLWGCFYL